jgi:hypothetical protein
MPGNESYYDRGSMDIDAVEMASESTIGGVLKKQVMKVDDDVEMKELKDKVEKMGDGDFVPVSDDYGNELCIYVDDFPELAKEARGSECMFVIRGAIKGVNEGPMMGKHGRAKLTCFIWDAALVHGACGYKKKENK